MPTLVRLSAGRFFEADDPYVRVDDAEPLPRAAPTLVSLARFREEGPDLLDPDRRVGIVLGADGRVEDLAYDLPRIDLVALEFPKFRDGRPYSSAAILRRRLRYRGEVRAVGEVLREQAFEMARAGFDAFAPADGSTAADFARVAARYRHVYQRAADGRVPAFVEREAGARR